MSLNRVDIYDPELIPVEAIALQRMMNKREQYVAQGRFREAHGAGSMISILWDSLKGGFHDTEPTSWGDL